MNENMNDTIKPFLQHCTLRSQDFAACNRECIEFENPDRCGSAFSPDSVRKISCLFNAINAVKTLFLSILDFTRNGIKHTNTYSQSRVHAACKQNITIHDMMKLQYCRIRMFYDSTTCRGVNTFNTFNHHDLYNSPNAQRIHKNTHLYMYEYISQIM